jgi:hypothetical protein
VHKISLHLEEDFKEILLLKMTFWTSVIISEGDTVTLLTFSTTKTVHVMIVVGKVRRCFSSKIRALFLRE